MKVDAVGLGFLLIASFGVGMCLDHLYYVNYAPSHVATETVASSSDPSLNPPTNPGDAIPVWREDHWDYICKPGEIIRGGFDDSIGGTGKVKNPYSGVWCDRGKK